MKVKVTYIKFTGMWAETKPFIGKLILIPIQHMNEFRQEGWRDTFNKPTRYPIFDSYFQLTAYCALNNMEIVITDHDSICA